MTDPHPVDAATVSSPGAKPIILAFQPDAFSIADTPEMLRAWESAAVERFALPQAVATALSEATLNGGTCCESGATNDCDVDGDAQLQ
jgi:hypothetical protein